MLQVSLFGRYQLLYSCLSEEASYNYEVVLKKNNLVYELVYESNR